MSDFIVALGLAIALEGCCYAAAPGAMKDFLKTVGGVGDNRLRQIGLGAMAIGVLLVWFIRG